MGILREIIARFDITADSKPIDELDKKMKRARDTIESLGKQMAAGWAAAGASAYYLVNAASDANESMNVLRQTFKDNSDEVVAWSQNLAKQLGRSEYTLQEAAGRFGAFLQPVFRDSNQDITKMSEQLSALAVDLSSFYNTSEEEAIMRLFSGMSGETEAVRRLGIDISDTSLDALNKKNGDNRRLASLSLQEKTLLRFQKIIQDTAEKQGDAARTAGDFANTTRRLQEQVKTLTIEMGQALLPYAMELARIIETRVIPVLKDLGMTSRFLESSFELAEYATGILTISFIALNAKAAAMTALMVGLILAYDDLKTFLEGGNSVLGEFITYVTDVKDPLDWWNKKLNEGIGWLDMFFAAIQDLGYILTHPSTWTSEEGYSVNRDAARARVEANQKQAGNLEAAYQQRLLQAAAGENYGQIKDIHKEFGRSTGTTDELNSEAKAMRVRALRNGLAIPTETDVAEGLAPDVAPSPLVKAPNQGNGMVLDAASRGQFPNSPLDASKTPIYQVNFNIEKLEGDPRKAAGWANEALRGAKQALGEKKQAQ